MWMRPEKVEQIREEFAGEVNLYNDAVTMWRAEDPKIRERIIPASIILVAFLMRRMSKIRAALRAAATHAKKTSKFWHKVPKDVIARWERI